LKADNWRAMLKKPELIASLLFAASLAGGSAAFGADAPAQQVQPSTPAVPSRPAPQSPPGAKAQVPDPRSAISAPAHYHADRFAGRAGLYYYGVWGIDSISVKLVESGELVRFSYRVLDPTKARVLNDKKNDASLIDAGAGVSLVVPTMEKVGQLRQGAPPEAGRSYWMAFSNKGRLVKRGDRVDVVIGAFRAKNLVID
jgi:hypothetical protein